MDTERLETANRNLCRWFIEARDDGHNGYRVAEFLLAEFAGTEGASIEPQAHLYVMDGDGNGRFLTDAETIAFHDHLKAKRLI